MLTVHVYQPVAAHLGYAKPGGFEFQLPLADALPLTEALRSYAGCEADLTDLADGEYGAACMIVVNGVLARAGRSVVVKDGDVVSVFKMVGGG